MKRIFGKKEEKNNEKKERKKIRFLNKKVLIAIMLMLILIVISMLIVARSNGIKNFGDVKNLISERLNSEEPKAASSVTYYDYDKFGKNGVIDSKYSYSTIFKGKESKVDAYGYKDDSGDDKYNVKGEVAYNIDSDGNSAVFLSNKDGQIEFYLYNSAVDEDGDMCDVKVEVGKPKQYNVTNTDGMDLGVGGSPLIDGMLKKDGDRKKNNIKYGEIKNEVYKGVKINNMPVLNRVSISKSGSLWEIKYATECAESNFKVTYLKSNDNSVKGNISNIFCMISDIDIKASSTKIKEGENYDNTFLNGNEGIAIPNSIKTRIYYETEDGYKNTKRRSNRRDNISKT